MSSNPFGPNCPRLCDVWPDVVLEPDKNYFFGKIAEGECPPKGKVIRYSRNTRMYLVERP